MPPPTEIGLTTFCECLFNIVISSRKCLANEVNEETITIFLQSFCDRDGEGRNKGRLGKESIPLRNLMISGLESFLVTVIIIVCWECYNRKFMLFLL